MRKWNPWRVAGRPFGVTRAVAGLGLAAAVGGPAAAGPPEQRAAVLLAPRPQQPSPAGTVARGAEPTAGVPVARAGGPGWLQPADPQVVRTAGTTWSRPGGEPATGVVVPASPRPPDGVIVGRGLDKYRGLGATEAAPQPAPGGTPAPVSAVTPGGGQVMAGPPAWRWYGYGSVTPGANAFAPGGQYPRASANWYSVTGATPGAFPVPVVNPFRAAPGSEPPVYAAGPVGRGPAVVPPTAPHPQAVAPAAPPMSVPTGTKFEPPPVPRPGPAGTAGIPTLAVPPVPGRLPDTMPVVPAGRTADPDPVAVPMPMPGSAAPGGDGTQWQPGGTRPAPPPLVPGPWVPASGAGPKPPAELPGQPPVN